jgi:hypothetical protein
MREQIVQHDVFCRFILRTVTIAGLIDRQVAGHQYLLENIVNRVNNVSGLVISERI